MDWPLFIPTTAHACANNKLINHHQWTRCPPNAHYCLIGREWVDLCWSVGQITWVVAYIPCMYHMATDHNNICTLLEGFDQTSDAAADGGSERDGWISVLCGGCTNNGYTRTPNPNRLVRRIHLIRSPKNGNFTHYKSGSQLICWDFIGFPHLNGSMAR